MRIKRISSHVKHHLVRATSMLPNLPYDKAYRLGLSRSKDLGPMPGAIELTVIVHLFYPELWPAIKKSLSNITAKYVLIVTCPLDKSAEITMLLEGESAIICALPNKGRDILPFLNALKLADALGCKYVLKLHSKKSPHRTDGGEWSAALLSDLVPNKKVVDNVLDKLKQDDTGIIGPRGEYLSLSVNFDANGRYMTELLNRIYNKRISYRTLQAERRAHGFFAGSMFWAPIEMLRPLLKAGYASSRLYQTENSQIDGTVAHAVERVFSLLPEINNRHMFQVSSSGIQEIAYDEGIVPDWSEVYISPK